MIIAVDPGVSGGIAWSGLFTGDGCAAMPGTVEALNDFVLDLLSEDRHPSHNHAYVEDVPKWTGRVLPGSSLAVLFRNFGRCEGVLTSQEFNVNLVTPQAWQKPLGLKLTRRQCAKDGDWKRMLRDEATKRFPTLRPTLKTADALLILHYGKNCTRL